MCQCGHVSLPRPRATLQHHAPVTARTLWRDRRYRNPRHWRRSYHKMYACKCSLDNLGNARGVLESGMYNSRQAPRGSPCRASSSRGEGRLCSSSDDYSALGVIWARSWRLCHGNKSVTWHQCHDPGPIRKISKSSLQRLLFCCHSVSLTRTISWNVIEMRRWNNFKSLETYLSPLERWRVGCLQFSMYVEEGGSSVFVVQFSIVLSGSISNLKCNPFVLHSMQRFRKAFGTGWHTGMLATAYSMCDITHVHRNTLVLHNPRDCYILP